MEKENIRFNFYSETDIFLFYTKFYLFNNFIFIQKNE